MGWGATPKDRSFHFPKAVSQGCAFPSNKQKVAVIVDGNAIMRGHASAMKAPTAPSFVAKMVLRKIPDGGNAKVVLILFDDGSKMIPQRAAVHLKRYGPYAPPSSEALAAVKVAEGASVQTPVVFPLLFGTAAGKRHAYTLLAKALFIELCRCYEAKRIDAFVVTDSESNAASHGTLPFSLDAVSRWGEADQKCYEASEASARCGFAPTVLTIDTDMVLQAIARWQDASPPTILLKKSTVCGKTLISPWKFNPSSRLSAALFYICAYGCDYSDPISAAGYRKRTVAILAKRAGDPPLQFHRTASMWLVKGVAFVKVSETVGVRCNATAMIRKLRSGRWELTQYARSACKTSLLKKEPDVGPTLKNVYTFSPSALLGRFRGATRVKKAKTMRSCEILHRCLLAAWAVVYFSGAGRDHVSDTKSYAGPPAFSPPCSAFLTATQKHKVPFIVYMDCKSSRSIVGARL